MPTFKDKNQLEWTVKLDAPTIVDVRSDCEIDLASLENGWWETLATDVVQLVDVISVICRPQYEERGLTSRQFGECLDGDSLESAVKALLAAAYDFFPPGQRSLLRSLVDRNAALREKHRQIAEKNLLDNALTERVGEAIDARISSEMELLMTRLRSPTSSPEPSASARPD